MGISAKEPSYFSKVCIERCGGACCDPWWGIISFPMVKTNGAGDIAGFKEKVMQALREREKRIVDAYVTDEDPKRALFDAPERYNVRVTEIKARGSTLRLSVLAMFAFRCRFIAADKSCGLHPSVLGGRDIRPVHCAYLGSLNARPGEKGYCRVIHAAESPGADPGAVDKAIDIERSASERHYREGTRTIEDAAGRVTAAVEEYAHSHLPDSGPDPGGKKTGRNDPCTCGSGKKFKRCCGR